MKKPKTPRYPKLKPCAHCGDKPYWAENEDSPRDVVCKFYGIVRVRQQFGIVRCRCGMSTPYGHERSSAYATWNQRVKTLETP